MTRRIGDRRWPAIGLPASLVAGGLVTVAVVAGPLASRAAAATSPGRLCAGQGVSGSLSTKGDAVPYKLFVPSGATVTVTGSVDIPVRSSLGGYDVSFAIDNIGAWSLGDYWNAPTSISPSAAYQNGGGPQDLIVTVHELTAGYIVWRFTAAVSIGANGVQGPGLAPRVKATYDGADKATAYAFDAQGRLRTVTDPGKMADITAEGAIGPGERTP